MDVPSPQVNNSSHSFRTSPVRKCLLRTFGVVRSLTDYRPCRSFERPVSHFIPFSYRHSENYVLPVAIISLFSVCRKRLTAVKQRYNGGELPGYQFSLKAWWTACQGTVYRPQVRRTDEENCSSIVNDSIVSVCRRINDWHSQRGYTTVHWWTEYEPQVVHSQSLSRHGEMQPICAWPVSRLLYGGCAKRWGSGTPRATGLRRRFKSELARLPLT